MKKMKKLHLLLAALLLTLLIPVCKPTIVEAATLKAPKTLTVKQGRNNISVLWSKVSGAKGYVIYRKTSPSQGWKRLKVVKAPTVKYLDKNIASGKSYYYTVRPYTSKSGKNSYGSYNKSGRNTVYLKEPKVTATKSHKSVTLKWNKTTGASGYEVYRKSGNSGYSKLDATTALSYTDKNVEPSTKYTYAVRAYKKSGKTTFRSLYYDDQNLVDVKTNKEPEVAPEPEIDINEAVESKVYVNGENGVIELYNKSNTNFYGIKYEINFYGSNDTLVWRVAQTYGIDCLEGQVTNYIGFRLTKNIDYSYYKIVLENNSNNGIGNRYKETSKYKRFVKLNDINVKHNLIFLNLSNSSENILDITLKVVIFQNGKPAYIKSSYHTLNVNEIREDIISTAFSNIPNIRSEDVKIMIEYIYAE